MQVNGQLACRSVPGSADRGRTVRPHPGPMILFLDVPQLPGELPGELPADSGARWAPRPGVLSIGKCQVWGN